MTDKEKINAIRAEVQNYIDAARKAHANITEGNFAHLLSFIDSLQEEPKPKFRKGNKVIYLNEEYVVEDITDHYILRSTRERTSVPVVHVGFGNEDYELRLVEEPVSAELIEELKKIVNIRECVSQGVPVIKIACHFAQWQKEQFEKNRLEHCNSITNEQAELEQGFIDQHLDKYNRMPTFLDAIEYGMRLQKEQMMKKAVDAECFGFQGAALFSFRLPSDKYLIGSKVKVIVIKED